MGVGMREKARQGEQGGRRGRVVARLWKMPGLRCRLTWPCCRCVRQSRVKKGRVTGGEG